MTDRPEGYHSNLVPRAAGRASAGTLTRARRAELVSVLAREHDGVVRRSDLSELGVGRGVVRAEANAGRWVIKGRHTVRVLAVPDNDRTALWTAVWESGGGAVLDGAAAMLASGVRGVVPRGIDIALPHRNRDRPVEGVRRHRCRTMPPHTSGGLPRVRLEHAAIRAAAWAVSDRQAALYLCLPVQQRLVPAQRLLEAWATVRPMALRVRGGSTNGVDLASRRQLIDVVLHDIASGAHALSELDFAGLCRQYGLPEPTRQVLRRGPKGRVYLDVYWEEAHLAVEIDGGQHEEALSPIDDALRQNSVVIGGPMVLRVPILGLRYAAHDFMLQVLRAYTLNVSSGRGA